MQYSSRLDPLTHAPCCLLPEMDFFSLSTIISFVHSLYYSLTQVQKKKMLAHLLAYSELLLAVRTFALSQLRVEAMAIVPSRTPNTGFVAEGGDEKINEFVLGSTVTLLATGSRFSYTMAGGPSERRLVSPINGTASLQTAIGVWCQNSAQATETYGDISTWCA